MKIGLLGLGSIGMRHARNLQALGHKVFGYDIDMKKRLALNGILYERDEVIDISDALIIATPTSEHFADTYELMSNDKNIIFIEKPLCSTMDEANLLESRGNLANVFLGYMLRFHPCVKAAKAWIDAGHIGKPLWAQFTCGQFNDKPDYLRDGVVLNWSHEIDLALYLLGPAKMDVASIACLEGQDIIADIVLIHNSGARSTIHLDYVTKNEIREGWIVGSEKNLGIDMLGRRVSFGKMVQEFGGDWNSDYIDEMQDFVKLAGPEGMDVASPMATGEDGLRVLEICHQVKKIAGLE